MKMIRIDEYSLATVRIAMLFDETVLRQGTAFVWASDDDFFLITNWHNVAGRNPFTGKHLSKSSAEPNKIRAWLNLESGLGDKASFDLHIYSENGEPLWRVSPKHGEKVDVVALPLTPPAGVNMRPINLMRHDQLALGVGLDVFILGYPFGIGPSGLPIWKRGSIAGEPQMLGADHPHMLIDTASRPGMSGSPVIRRSWTTHTMENGDVNMNPGSTATRIVGVYSGRLNTVDPLDAQLGICWPIAFVEEIISEPTP